MKVNQPLVKLFYNTPVGRSDHVMVWADSTAEVIVWGGDVDDGPLTDTGARYDPVADTWVWTTPWGAPSARSEHRAGWAGSVMVVLGGYGADVDIPAFRATVVDSMEQIIADHRGERVAVFCHGGVVNVWSTHVLDMTPRLFFEPRYTSNHRYLCASSGERNLMSLNEVAHLSTLL